VALVYADLYAALRSANVPPELAQKASLADRSSFSSHDRTRSGQHRNDPVCDIDTTLAKLESHFACIKVMLFVNFLLLLVLLVFI